MEIIWYNSRQEYPFDSIRDRKMICILGFRTDAGSTATPGKGGRCLCKDASVVSEDQFRNSRWPESKAFLSLRKHTKYLKASKA